MPFDQLADSKLLNDSVFYLEVANKATVLPNKQSYKKQASNISREIVRWKVCQNKAPELLRLY